MTEKSITGAPGLRLKMHGSGATGTWSVLGRVHGKKVRIRLGDYPGITETKAKRLAAEARADMARGSSKRWLRFPKNRRPPYWEDFSARCASSLATRPRPTMSP